MSIGAGRESIQKSELMKGNGEKERRQRGKGSDKRRVVSMLSMVKWDGVVLALRRDGRSQAIIQSESQT